MTAVDVEFDPFSDVYFNDPTEVYRRLRDEAPLYFNEKFNFYALSRYEDVERELRDHLPARVLVLALPASAVAAAAILTMFFVVSRAPEQPVSHAGQN